MANRLFRVAGRRGEPVSSAELARYEFLEVPADKPHPEFWRGEWYCTNERCTVREVTVQVKYEGRDPLPLKCPLCGVPLKFHHYVETLPLLPVED